MTSFQRLKHILLTDNPWQTILAEKELFDSTIQEMDGVPHVNYHSEGGVLDHVKLAFEEMLKIPDHDWLDLLIVLFHDVGKRKALAENNGKNMAKHEEFSVDWFDSWNREHSTCDSVSARYILPARWVIKTHMTAHHLHESKSPYKVMNIVTNEQFPRLARLATADARATLDESRKPRWSFSKVLASPNVQRWLGKPRPCPIVTADDFIDRGISSSNIEVLDTLVEFGLKIQLNSGHTVPERIIHDVLSCDKMKDIIDRTKAMLGG